eukprot:CAMPEP_0114262198 /NCGR_PEP_ID=MMETSP0058-20121206/21644_1 /TAXON_ID=36894 /ORGANISM="Pyramimonas parkeae, CCMP726" /LENGTH=128 /DNA_ID=CAMNT_0001377987 /DNA_START=359 /DNA_END=742 /DNA_ORIENTATION=+
MLTLHGAPAHVSAGCFPSLSLHSGRSNCVDALGSTHTDGGIDLHHVDGRRNALRRRSCALRSDGGGGWDQRNAGAVAAKTGAEASMEEGVVVTVLEDTGRPTGADGGMGAGGACWGLSSTSDATGEAG